MARLDIPSASSKAALENNTVASACTTATNVANKSNDWNRISVPTPTI